MSEGLRRSTRERKKAETIYDSAEKANPNPKPSNKKKRKSRSEKQDDEKDRAAAAAAAVESEEETSLVSREDEEDVQMDEAAAASSSESSSEEEEESEAEEEAPPPRKRRTPVKSQKLKRSSAAAASSTKKKSPTATSAAKKRKGGGGAKKGSTAAGPITRAQAVAALKSLEKKYIEYPDDDETEETEENSLVVALFSSYSDGGTGKKKKRGASTDENESFYTAGLQKIAQRVIEEYGENSVATEVNLFNLILRSVGGDRKSLLDPEKSDLEEMTDEEFDELIQTILSDMEDVPADRTPFVANTTKLTTGQSEYRKIFSEFWYRLAQTSLTVEGSGKSERFRVETTRDLVAHMAELLSLGVPDIRMGILTAVYQMSRAMLERTVELRNKVTTAERQLAVAKRSKQQRKEESLAEQIDSWKRTIDDCEKFVQEMVVSTVIVKRYRDSCEFIRVATLETLTEFCVIRPDLFVTNMYLKYFGWMLSDHDAGVRVASIKGLLVPLEKESVDTDAMDKVLGKFLSRLTDMTTDVNQGVQEVAMALLLKLLRCDYFEKVKDDSIWDRINAMALDTDASPTFRRDALYFVLEQIEDFDAGSCKTEREAVDQIAKLSLWIAGVLTDSDIPLDEVEYARADLVVSALRAMPEHMSLATNWSAMLRALQSDKNRRKSSSSDQRLDTAQQRILLRMFVTAVKMEVSDAEIESEAVVDSLMMEAVQSKQDALVTVQATNTKTNKQKKKNDSHEELTLALLRSLPDLLLRFKSETSVLASLTTLPQYFLPNVLNLSRLKKEFEGLCSNLSNIFLESTDPTTLGNCLRAIVSLAKGEHSRSDEAVVVLQDLATTLRSRLQDLMKERSKLGNKESTNDTDDSDDEDESTPADLASSIHQCFRRMGVLSKRWSMADLLGGDEKDKEIEALSESVTAYMMEELQSRQLKYHRAETQDTAASVEAPTIWKKEDSRHADVAGSILEGLQLLLSMAAWRLRDETDKVDDEDDDENEDYSDEQLKNHIVIRLRDRIKGVIHLCYEHHIGESHVEILSDNILEFSSAVQEHALRASADLRSLFLKQWQKAESKLLRACALTDDSVLIGAGVRFVHLEIDHLRSSVEEEDGADGSIEAWDKLLLPMGRGLASNWEIGNRREAAMALAQITGAGPVAHELVQTFSRTFKRLHFVRLLEAQMACLRQQFEAWAEAEPEELGDRPSDRELAAFEEAMEAHQRSKAELQTLASKFSTSLGVGKIKDKQMVAGLLGFMREGVRFAFSTDDPGSEEDLPLGARLSFLSIMSKYLTWIRKDDGRKKQLAHHLNHLEANMRSHEDYEEIYEEDKQILADFRKQGGLGEFYLEEEETTTYNASQSRKSSIPPPRNSLGTSVSSIPSRTSGQGSLESIQEEPEGGSGASTPSPTKRSFVPSSNRTFGSVSSLGTRDTRGSLSPQRRKRTEASAQSEGSASSRDTHDSPPLHRHKRPSVEASSQSGEDTDDEVSPKKRLKSQQDHSEEPLSADSKDTSVAPSVGTPSVHSKLFDTGDAEDNSGSDKSPDNRRKIASPDASEGLPSVYSNRTANSRNENESSEEDA